MSNQVVASDEALLHELDQIRSLFNPNLRTSMEVEEVVISTDEVSCKIRELILTKLIPDNLPKRLHDKISEELIKKLKATMVELKKDCPELSDDTMLGMMLSSLKFSRMASGK